MKTFLLLLFLCTSVLGQQPNTKQPSKISFIESSSQFWAGTAFDHLSSRGRSEANPFLRDTTGNLNTSRFYVSNAAIYTVTLFFQKKYPRAMNWTRRAVGWLHFGVSVHNLTKPKGAFR
ncbi:MAG: hypothetical protein WBV94_00445 [Blastocatellia bacterium]